MKKEKYYAATYDSDMWLWSVAKTPRAALNSARREIKRYNKENNYDEVSESDIEKSIKIHPCSYRCYDQFDLCSTDWKLCDGGDIRTIADLEEIEQTRVDELIDTCYDHGITLEEFKTLHVDDKLNCLFIMIKNI